MLGVVPSVCKQCESEPTVPPTVGLTTQKAPQPNDAIKQVV